jgi:hypothetical protein
MFTLTAIVVLVLFGLTAAAFVASLVCEFCVKMVVGLARGLGELRREFSFWTGNRTR